MSARVLRRVLARLAALRFDVEADRRVVAALRAAFPGPARALLGAGRDARLSPDDALERAAVAHLAFATFNLSDDLSDGDCTYLSTADAAAVLLVVHGLFFAGLTALALQPAARSAVLAHLAAAEEAQLLEIATPRWTADRLWRVTDGIAGRQWAAYLHLMWAGTELEARAPAVARDLGRVALLADDIRCGDVRWTGLPPADRQAVLRAALGAAESLRRCRLSFVLDTVEAFEPLLRGHLEPG